jgi:hypothetical protein
MKDHSQSPPRDKFREFIRRSGLSDEEKQAILDLEADAARLPSPTKTSAPTSPTPNAAERY